MHLSNRIRPESSDNEYDMKIVFQYMDFVLHMIMLLPTKTHKKSRLVDRSLCSSSNNKLGRKNLVANRSILHITIILKYTHTVANWKDI